MKRRAVLAGVMSLAYVSAHAAVPKVAASSANFVEALGHLQGQYAILGKSPLDGSLYQGIATITVRAQKIEIVRNIAGKLTRATLLPEAGEDGNYAFLKCEFFQKGERFQGIYRWHMDGDNYACFTAKLIIPSHGEMNLGYESFYPVQE